jgi:RhtB (resistance to homoserine/threonine) family protein
LILVFNRLLSGTCIGDDPECIAKLFNRLGDRLWNSGFIAGKRRRGDSKMFGIENYIGFIAAGILLNITPGADTMYILTRSVAQGKRAGVVSVLGISSGLIVHVVSAACGLSILLKTSATLFTAIKWVGAGYLVFLGFQMLRQSATVLAQNPDSGEPMRLGKIYRQGIITNVLNPKVALFFLSFLPQFVRPESAHSFMPFLVLGSTFLITGTAWCLFLAYAASMMTAGLRRHSRAGKFLHKLSGLVFVGLGLQLAFKRS